MTKKQRKVRLTRRDYSILRDAAQFGMVVPEFLQAYRFADKEPSAVRSTLRRLYGEPPSYRYLCPESLDSKRMYYRLTVSGCHRLGVPLSLARRLGKNALAERYASMWFLCVDRPQARKLFDPQEFPEQFPQLGGRLPKRRFYFEQAADGSLRVGYYLIDLRSDVRRLVQRGCRLMRGFIAEGLFNAHLVHGRFHFAALSFSQEKALDLEQSLKVEFARQLSKPLTAMGLSADQASCLPVQVHVVPGLDRLIPD